MYGSSYRAYPYTHLRHGASASSHSLGPRHSDSQSTLRSKPASGASTGTSRNDSYSGMGIGNNSHDRRYKSNGSTNPLDTSSTWARSQPRSQSAHLQNKMDPSPYSSWPSSSPSSRRRGTGYTIGSSGQVIPDSPEFDEMFQHDLSNGTSSGRYGQFTYFPGRAHESGPVIPPFLPPLPGYPTSAGGMPFGYAGPPPELLGGWPRSSASSFPAPPPCMFGPSMGPPVIPPMPTSFYPPMSHGGSSANNGAYPGRSYDTGERRGRDRRPKPLNVEDRTTAPRYPAATPSQADSTASDPLIHPALGWWPDQRRPALCWDLSSSTRPRYTKREFDAAELVASPFTPPLSHMRLVLDPRTQCAFDISAPRGERYLTLSSLLKEIAALMRAPNKVQHAFWVRASSSKKEAILRAFLKRTGRPLAFPPPHRRPKSRGQIMEEAVVDGAPRGYTNLLVIDLLCDDVMFAGMEFHKEPDEWVLRTTKRY